MLSSQLARLSVHGARRAVLVAGQRRAVVQAVKRSSPALTRGLQSVAQTDRVSLQAPPPAKIPLNEHDRTLL